MTDFAEDEIRIGSPDKGLAISIVMGQVLVNGLLQLTHAAEGAAANPFIGDLGEKAFHLVKPAGGGGCEMHMIVGMLHKPALHLVDLVRAVIVHHQMDLLIGRNRGSNTLEKAQELLMTMTAVATADQLAGSDVERGK